MSYRLKNHDMTIVSPMRFQQHHEARTTIPFEDALNDELFLDVRSSVQVGDVVNLCRYSSNDEAAPDLELLELAVLRIKFKDDTSCSYHVVSKTDLTKRPAPKVKKVA